MANRLRFSILASLIALAAFAPLAVGRAQDNLLPAKIIDDVRDKRYCEFFVVTGHIKLEAAVYNTLGLNDCPPEIWQAIDLAKVKEQFDATEIVVNGPRHFIMDTIESADVTSEVTNVQGLDMHVVAKLEIPFSARFSKPKPYTIHTIDRTTTYTFKADEPIFELIASDSRTFVMQAYALIVDPNLTYDQMAGIGGRLKLPDGWQYRSRVLDSDLVMSTTGKAEIIQDDLDDTYQLMAQ
jgi:haloalkane dehalogenase